MSGEKSVGSVERFIILLTDGKNYLPAVPSQSESLADHRQTFLMNNEVNQNDYIVNKKFKDAGVQC